MFIGCPRPIVYLSAVSVALAGCASTSQYREAGDPCSAYREPFIEAQEAADESLGIGALVGAGLGLTAGLACVAAGGSATTCSGIGAGIFLAGTAIGFYQKKRKEAANQKELQEVIDQEADVSEVALSKLGQSLSNLNSCRLSQLAALQQRFDSGQTDPVTARTELNAIDALRARDQELITLILGKADERATGIARDKAAALNLDFDEYMARQPPQPPPDAPVEPVMAKAAKPARPKKPVNATYYMAARAGNLREGPSLDAPVRFSVLRGTPLSMQYRIDEWYEVRYQDTTLFVHRAIVTNQVPAPLPPPALRKGNDRAADFYFASKQMQEANAEDQQRLAARSAALRQAIDAGTGGVVSG